MGLDKMTSRSNKPGSRVTHAIGAATLGFLAIVTVMAVFAWLRPLAGWSRTVANLAGGAFGLSAYIYLAAGGYNEMTESAEAKAGRRRSIAAYVGFVPITLLTLAWLANLAEAAWDLHGQPWLSARRVLTAALIASVLLYLIIRVAQRRRRLLRT